MKTFPSRFFLFISILFLGTSIFSHAQTTVNFNNYIVNETFPGLSHIEGELEFEVVLGPDGVCTNCIGVDIDEGKDGTTGLDDANFEEFGIVSWKISKADNSSFQFLSFWIQHRGLGSTSGTIKAFKGGSQVGSTVNINFDSQTAGLKSFASNPDFYDVDEVLIEAPDVYVILDDVTYGTPFVVGDADPAEVTGINLVGAPLTTAASVDYTVTFSKNANNVTSDDFELTTVGTIGTVGAVTGSGDTYNVNITGIDGEGTIRLDLKAGTDIANDDDAVGTAAYTSGQLHYVGECFVETFETETDESTTFSGNGLNFTLGTGLKIEKRAGFGAGPSNGYIANNFTAGTFSLSSGSEFTMKTIDLFLSDQSNGDNPTATGTVVITGKKGGVDQFTITKSSGFPTNTTVNNGFFTLDFATDGAANYRDTNVDELVFTISGGFTELAIDNMNFCEAAPDVDTDAPAVNSILKVGNPISTSTAVDFQVTFDENANNVTTDDFELIRTGTATGAITGISGSGSVYTLNVTGISGEGSIQVKLLAGTDIADDLGNTPTFEYVNGELHLVGACYIENFETFLDGITAFTSNGVDFTLGGNWAVNIRNGYGINSSDNYIENTGAGTYTIDNSEPVRYSQIAFFLSSEVGSSINPTNDGTLTIRGVRNGATEYTITKSTAFPTDFSSNNGFFYIDFATEGGADNSGTYVDGLEIEIGGSFVYLAVDNLQFCKDFEAPTGYSVTIDQDPITVANSSAISFTFAGAELDATYNYTFSTSGGATTVVGSGTIATATDQITGIDLSSLEVGTITLSVTLTDLSGNTGDPATDTSTKLLNNAPIATAPTAPVVNEDISVDLVDDIQITDSDGDNQTVTFTITGGTFTIGTTGITFGGSGNGSASFTAAGTLAAINTALDAATFTPALNLSGAGAGSISFVSNDGAVDSNTASVTFDINAVNDDPTFTGLPASITVTEDVIPSYLSNALSGGTFGDVDAGSSTVSLFLEVDSGNFGFANPATYSINIGGNGTGDATITGTVANIETYLNINTNVSYTPPLNLNGTNAATVTLSANDGGNIGTGGGTDVTLGSFNINIIPVNDPPFFTGLPTDISVQDGIASNLDLSSATFGDVDSGTGDVTLTFIVGSGTFSATSGGGVTVSFPLPQEMNLTGTAAAIETFFNTPSNIQYTNAPGSTGDNADFLGIGANDNGNTGSGGAKGSVFGTINIDVESANTLSINDVSVAEGDAGTSTIQFTVSLGYPAPPGGATVDYATSDGTATAGSDYTAGSGTVIFAGGESSKTIDIPVFGDTDLEGSETIILTLSNPTGTGVVLADDTGIGTITNDDQASVTIADVSVNESDGNATISVTLDNAVQGGFSVDASTADGTATTADSDYSSVITTLTFVGTAGEIQTFQVPISDDSKVELDETVSISMSNLASTTLGVDITDEATLTISNDDQATVTIADVMEFENNGPITVTATLDNAVVGGFSVNVSTLDGTAIANVDYTPVVTSLDFAGTAGETQSFNVTLIDDGIVEPDETLTVSMSGLAPSIVSSAVIDITDGATVTIRNDDVDPPSTPDLAPSSDSGISDTDNITNDLTPTFTGTTFANGTINIFSDSDGYLGTTIADGLGNWTFTAGSNVSTGIHSITATATDPIDNDSPPSGALSVTFDNQAPTPILINGLSLQLDVNGLSPTITPDDLLANPISDDYSASGDILLSLDKTTFDCSNVGSNSVTVTATDEAGNSDFEVTSVLVQDLIVPIIKAKASITLNVEAFGTVDLTVGMVDEGSFDNCSILSQVLSKTTFDRNDEGVNTVSYTVTDVNGNPLLVNIAVTIVVVPKVLNIVTDPGQSKVYGDADPVFTYTATGFEGGDDETILTGALVRTTGENVGSYAINQGTLDAGPNYAINFTPAAFEITPATLDITADAGQTKVYGDADPVFTYQVTGYQNGDGAGVLTGALGRTAGEDVGSYAINQGTLDAGPNYTINFTPADFEITPTTLNITADAGQSKVYGEADPVFTYMASGFKLTDTESVITGALARTAGEAVGTYPINQGTLDAGTNYVINFTSADFEITPATLDVTADAGQTKVYGDADPVFTYQVTGYQNGDGAGVLTGALGRTAGEAVGIYAINQGTLDAGSNYTINFTGADFEITPATLNITADARQSKVYGEADPVFTYMASGFKLTDTESVITGALTRVAGEDVGSYAINQGTLDAGPNYTINFTPADFEITPATLDVTADAGQTKVYGDADPVFTYQVTGYQNGDGASILTGALIRISGEDVGMYAIQPGTIDAGPNYVINFTSADFEITPATLDVTADAGQTKVYGDADPVFTYMATGFKNGDTEALFTGALIRISGEDVGIYAIQPGTIDAGPNYVINFNSADFEITPRTLNIMANPNQAKVYGSADPVLTYTASNFGNGDNNSILTGALSREFGEKKGKYAILIGSLSAGSNYTINFTSATFTIAAKVLNVTADAGQGKVFGTADPVLTYQVSGFENGDDAIILSGDLARAPGENIGNYPINLGTLDAGFNYAINYTGADFTISKADIAGITFEDGTFVYDGTEKSLAIGGTLPAGTSVAYTNNGRADVGTQEVTATISGSNYNTLVLTADLTITPAAIGDVTFADESFVYDGTEKSLMISGSLPEGASVAYTNNTRTDVGTQEVTATINGSNFNEVVLMADLSITPATLMVMADEGQSKEVGTMDPELTFDATGFKGPDTEAILTGMLSREAGEEVGNYPINQGSLSAGMNYDIDFTGADFIITEEPNVDSDGDGVPDKVEEEQGTDPNDPNDYPDGDEDGVPDYVEESEGTDPNDAGDYVDSDEDDVPDYVEEQQGTDPNDAEDFPDMDEDGVPDYVTERSITEFVAQSMEVVWGTMEEDLKVPTEVVLITSKGEFINLPVTWDLTGYEPMSSGGSDYNGTVDIPSGIFNPSDLTPVLTITVLDKPAPLDVSLSENSFIGIPDQFFQEIGGFTVLDPSDDVHTLTLPEGVQDNEFFEVIDGILFWSSAEQAQGRTDFTILLRVEDRGGNVLEKSFQITRERTPLDQLELTNTFTPNNDGVNDTWGVPALRYYQGVRISIMEVGGNRVFYTENPDVRWDGTFDGKDMPVGAYFWIIEVEETGEVRRGVLNLLRQ